MQIPTFIINHTYSRAKDLHAKYGGSRQSGISSSKDHPVIFIFTGSSGAQYGYVDEIDEAGVFYYTGEGQTGDMKFDRGNATIRDHALHGKSLHVFHSLGKGNDYKYSGEYIYASHHFDQGLDKHGTERRTIVFHLVPMYFEGSNPVEVMEAEEADHAPSLEQLRNQALKAASSHTPGVTSAEAVKSVYRRSKAVADYVLMRANGICESCKQPAPFSRLKDNSPYLEPHHTHRVSDGGPDHPRFVGAICPNCHREIHSGVNGKDLNEKLIKHVQLIEL